MGRGFRHGPGQPLTPLQSPPPSRFRGRGLPHPDARRNALCPYRTTSRRDGAVGHLRRSASRVMRERASAGPVCRSRNLAQNYLPTPRSALEIGCGTGRTLAYLAQPGSPARGVDLSPVMVKKTTTKWAITGGSSCAPRSWVSGRARRGVRRDLLHLRRRLVRRPGPPLPTRPPAANPGVSRPSAQPPAIPGAYGPQACTREASRGKAMFTYRYSYRRPCGRPAHPARVRHGRCSGTRPALPWAHRDASSSRGRSVTEW